MISINLFHPLKTFAGKQNLRTDIVIEQGEIIHLSGVSGSGKTTLLNFIAGFAIPAEGRISVGDQIWLDTAGKINLAVNKRKPGFVFQHYGLFPHMTVKQHLEYACSEKGLIAELIHMAGLQDFCSHRPAALSAGQQQRLGIVRALATKPRLLLMDEPFSALDETGKSALMNSMKEFMLRHGITAIVASHNFREMSGFSGRELLMQELTEGS